MLDVKEIVNFFKFDTTNIDNWVFKLFYKGCFILFLIGSAVGILIQYFGDPMNCDFAEKMRDLANNYCWLHSKMKINNSKCKQRA